MLFRNMTVAKIANDLFMMANQKGVDSRTRTAINNALIDSGMDGNSRFLKTGDALSKISRVLSNFGIEWDEVLPTFILSQPKGNIMVHLAWSNEDDPFSPTSIHNTALTFQWDTLATGVEVIAYLG